MIIPTETTFICSQCQKTYPTMNDNRFTQRGVIRGESVCIWCCGERDKKSLETDDTWIGYLTQVHIAEMMHYRVSNWPGTMYLEINPRYVKKSKQNWGHTRLDVYFTVKSHTTPDGTAVLRTWHGIQSGDNDVIRCKVIKRWPRTLGVPNFVSDEATNCPNTHYLYAPIHVQSPPPPTVAP